MYIVSVCFDIPPRHHAFPHDCMVRQCGYHDNGRWLQDGVRGRSPHLLLSRRHTALGQREIFNRAPPTNTSRAAMSMKETAIQRIREAPSAPGRDTFIPPTLLPVCCACRLIRDDTRFSPGRELWITQRTYRETHGVNPADLAPSHTYCPNCFRKVEDTVRQDFQEIGIVP